MRAAPAQKELRRAPRRRPVRKPVHAPVRRCAILPRYDAPRHAFVRPVLLKPKPRPAARLSFLHRGVTQACRQTSRVEISTLV